jgi:hypothetical protein
LKSSPGVHAHALGQLAAHDDLLLLVEQRDLDAVDLGGMRVDDGDGGLHRAMWSALPQ